MPAVILDQRKTKNKSTKFLMFYLISNQGDFILKHSSVVTRMRSSVAAQEKD